MSQFKMLCFLLFSKDNLLLWGYADLSVSVTVAQQDHRPKRGRGVVRGLVQPSTVTTGVGDCLPLSLRKREKRKGREKKDGPKN